MKIEWPTEIAQTPEGQFYQRRLSVLEIILRPIAELVLTTIVTVNDSIIALSTYVIDAFANTFRYLELKYSRGKDKQEQSGGYEYDPYAKDDGVWKPVIVAKQEYFLERIKALIIENHYRGIKSISVHPKIMTELCGLEKTLPATLYGFPVTIHSSESSTEFVLEIEWPEKTKLGIGFIDPHSPMDSGYSSPLLSPVTYRK